MTLLELLTGPWAIQPDKLREIHAIYSVHVRGEKIDVAAIEARIGHPLASQQQDYEVRGGGVAMLAIDGILAPKANLLMQISGGASTQMLTRQVESAQADSRVRSMVLDFNSPGGAVTGTPELAAAVRAMAGVKPVVTITSSDLSSAAYWVGAATNAIYVTGPTTQVGSIGVVSRHSFDPKAGETDTEITAGKYKRMVSGIAPLSAEGRALIQADADYVYSVFVDAVADYRGTSAANVLEHMADGRVFRGQQAINAGLVDGVSTVDALVEKLATDPARFARRRKAVFALGGLSVSTGAGALPEDNTSLRELKGTVMPENQTQAPVTRESFERDNAALFAQIRSEFVTLGAAQERDRINQVRATAVPGHEKLIEQLAFDGKSTAGDAAMAINAAIRQQHQTAAAAHAADAPNAVPHSPAPPDQSNALDPKTASAQAAAAAIATYRKSNGVTHA